MNDRCWNCRERIINYDYRICNDELCLRAAEKGRRIWLDLKKGTAEKRAAKKLLTLERRRKYLQRPEVKELKREYNQRPEVKELKREYEQRPEVKERRREYMREYFLRKKAEREEE